MGFGFGHRRDFFLWSDLGPTYLHIVPKVKRKNETVFPLLCTSSCLGSDLLRFLSDKTHFLLKKVHKNRPAS